MNRVHENGRACNACEHVLAREGDGFCSHCGAPISAEAREAVAPRPKFAPMHDVAEADHGERLTKGARIPR